MPFQQSLELGQEEGLIHINAPHFSAGVRTKDGKVAYCAPILKYMHGWNVESVFAYARKKGWDADYRPKS